MNGNRRLRGNAILESEKKDRMDDRKKYKEKKMRKKNTEILLFASYVDQSFMLYVILNFLSFAYMKCCTLLIKLDRV